MQNRTIIQNVHPEIDGGIYFIKRVPGETVTVTADIFADGHDTVRAMLLYRPDDAALWQEVEMKEVENDEWTATFPVEKRGFYHYKIEAWVDHLLSWLKGFRKKQADGQDMKVELQIGANLLQKTAEIHGKTKSKQLTQLAKSLEKEAYENAVQTVLSEDFAQAVQDFPMRQFETTYDKNLQVRVGRERELFSSWYELFPRSASQEVGRPGTFQDVEKLLPRIEELGFDVLYLPPVHPIGKLNRKGRNNAVTANEGEPGSPWAIGSEAGGHKAIEPSLGTIEDYKNLIQAAKAKNIDIALDLAFQCAPDHPYIKEHPEWFLWRPDGSIAYAENPPKKYQDIVPIYFETEDWRNLWDELLSVVQHWCEAGVTIFRVDNPHTKPFRFWHWLIAEIQKDFPDTIFLAEAFTRPKIMAELGKLGFSQSYTYYTWRLNKREMEQYLTELTQTESRDYYRPNFWPNTPDILTYEMMGAGSNKFALRYLMAATLSSNYGLYGPSYEFLENTGNPVTGKEEYYDSEKYLVRYYDWSARNRLTDLYTRVNRIRRENRALQTTWNLHFTRTDNDQLMSYVKVSEGNIIWCIANFDANQTQAGWIEVPKQVLGIEGRVNLKVTDLLSNETYYWFNDWNYVELNPSKYPIHILRVERN
jgi:starch synthase (maltosyl-transferring)